MRLSLSSASVRSLFLVDLVAEHQGLWMLLLLIFWHLCCQDIWLCYKNVSWTFHHLSRSHFRMCWHISSDCYFSSCYLCGVVFVWVALDVGCRCDAMNYVCDHCVVRSFSAVIFCSILPSDLLCRWLYSSRWIHRTDVAGEPCHSICIFYCGVLSQLSFPDLSCRVAAADRCLQLKLHICGLLLRLQLVDSLFSYHIVHFSGHRRGLKL